MIRCPKCGTMNRDGSRLCKQCGTTLPQTTIWCPQCGAPNPVGNVRCDNCNARLITAAEGLPSTPELAKPAAPGVKGISLPTVPIAEDGTPEPAALPDWLADLTEESLGPTSGDAAEDEPAPAELPDWLSGLVDDDLMPSEEATPDTEPESPAAAALPDWLSDFEAFAPEAAVDAVSEPAAPEASPDVSGPEDVAPAELPDWLSGLPEAEAGIVASPAEPPGWSPDETSVGAGSEVAEELPDWLRAGSDQTPASESPAPHTLPSWLAAAADEASPAEERGEKAVPDWLQPDYGIFPVPSTQPGERRTAGPADLEAASTGPSADEEPLSESEAPAQGEVPDWLAELDVGEPQEGMPAKAEEPSTVHPGSPSEAHALPDWLAGLAPLETEAVAPESAAEIPDWLTGALGEESETAVPRPEPSSKEEEALPDWLVDIAATEGESATRSQISFETPPEETPPDRAAGVVDRSSTFEGEAAVPEAEAESLPDWLSALDAVAEGEVAVSPALGPEELPAEAGLVKTDLPAWLQDVSTIPDETAPKPAAPAFVSEDVTDEDRLPGESAALDEAPPEEEEGLPEWLQGLEPASEEQPLLDEAALSDEERLARAEVPAWVQHLRPPGTGPLPTLPEIAEASSEAMAEEEGGLARAEIPDWVQHLRPSPEVEGGIPPEGGLLIEPVEVKGPLAGLSGVLPAGLAVDMPVDYKRAPSPVLPESIVAQAQLWQTLLEQPRSVERPVAQQRLRSGTGETAMRLIVGLVLVVVTVFGLWLGGPRWSQALHKPAVERLGNAIEALQPGDRVVVAVEYGPAEAGEMTPIAKALLDHLADRQIEVIAVSTLPEGSGIAQSLLASGAASKQLPEGRSVYLPGASNGVALFLGENMENVDMLLVLSARAERLRWWVELNNASRPGMTAGSFPIPMGIGVSASVGPLVSPYLNSAQIEGGLVGFPDVVAYREFRGLAGDFFNSRLDALMFAHWAALGLLILGFIYYLASGKKRSV